MASRIYTYTSVNQLRELSYYQEIRCLPHITASTDLARAMQQNYPELQDIISIDRIQDTVFPQWQDDAIIFQQYITISDIIRSLQLPPENETLKQSFTKNRKSVLNAARNLMAAGAAAADIDTSTREMALFQHIYAEFEERSGAYCTFANDIAALAEQPQIFIRLISSEYPCFDCDTIIMHGFFYITPIQQRIMDCFELAGKDIIYLCCMDPELSCVQEIWEKTFSQDLGFPARGQRIAGTAQHQKNYAFGEIFDRNDVKVKETYSNIKIIKYRSELDFVRDADRISSSGLALFSSDPERTEELLKTYYPERFRRRHLLSYPVGQYLFQLHSMWDAKSRQVTMTYEDVRTCFASGWLTDGSTNAKSYMNALESLRPYLARCRTCGDWTNSLHTLIEARGITEDAFEQRIRTVPEENRRSHRIMANPLLSFSAFSVSPEDIQGIGRCIDSLSSAAADLFSGGDSIRISSYMQKLRTLLRSAPADDSIYEEERLIIQEIMSRLNFQRLAVEQCHADDLKEAIMMIIGSGILDADGLSFEDDDDAAFIKHLTKIEALPLTKTSGVHLCLADESSMPGTRSPLPWPLTLQALSNMEEKASGKQRRYLHQLISISENAPIVKRYLFFSLLQNENVELSWIEKQGDKNAAASPYIQILQSVFLPQYEEKTHSYAPECKPQGHMRQRIPDTINISCDGLQCSEALYDAALCRWRYLYGYVLNDHPAYRSEFHWSFLITQLISALSGASGLPKESIAYEIMSMMPCYNDIERRQMTDYSTSLSSTGTDSLDSFSYPRNRLLPHFLKRSILNQAKKLAEEIEGPSDEIMPLSMNEDLGREICMYCPFSEDCPHAVRTDE